MRRLLVVVTAVLLVGGLMATPADAKKASAGAKACVALGTSHAVALAVTRGETTETVWETVNSVAEESLKKISSRLPATAWRTYQKRGASTALVVWCDKNYPGMFKRGVAVGNDIVR